jgi:transcriptional regulator with XRE-family HTH domain
MDARVNVRRILEAMEARRWGIAATAVNCGMNNKTVTKILDGEIPSRLDALYRLCDGLKISIQEALIVPTSKVPPRPLYVVSGGRRGKTFSKDR